MDTKAIVLCAGKGTRLAPLTDTTHKSMLPLNGLPILEHIIQKLVASGIHQIGINICHKLHQIKNYFGDGKKWGAEIYFFEEEAPSGTAGGVKKLAPFIGNTENFLVWYGDILTDHNIKKICGQSY